MSRFNVIFALFLGFSSPALMMGMNFSWLWSKPKNDHYLDEYIKKLMLFRSAANCESDQGELPQDVKNCIALQGYRVHRDSWIYDSNELDNFDFIINNKKRLKEFQGTGIDLNHPAIVMMNDDTKKNIINLKEHVKAYDQKSNNFVHWLFDNYYHNNTIIQDDFNPEFKGETYLMLDDYERVLDIPVEWRNAVGVLSTVPVLEKKNIIFEALWFYVNLNVKEKPLVSEKYEEALSLKKQKAFALQKFVDRKEEQMLKALPAQLKKVRSNNPMNLRNRE